jgi:glycerol-3-phosphate acyltransferase PlsY
MDNKFDLLDWGLIKLRRDIMRLAENALILLIAYLLGSIPTALIYSRFKFGMDIRELGDGNMGARNSKRQFGWSAGILVALADILKGCLAILLAKEAESSVFWQYLAGAAVILGHDFPIFAHFKGGQGFAVTTGVFLGLFTEISLVGFCIYIVIYFTTRVSDLAAGIGMGFVFITTWITGTSFLPCIFIVLILLFIPFKKWIDRGRMKNSHGRMNLSI